MATISEAYALALKHYQAGQFQQAEQIFRQIVQADPGQADAFNRLGGIAYERGDYARAVEHFRRAIALRPANASYHNNLGLVYYILGRLPEAIASYRQALRHQSDAVGGPSERGDPQPELDFPRIYSNLGVAFKDLGKLDEAVACFREALRLNPGYADVYNNLGVALTAQGMFDEAVASHEQALRLEKGLAHAYYNLGELASKGHYRFTGEDVGRIQALVEHGGLPLFDRSQLLFTLAGLLDKAGRYDEAFAHYRQANEIYRQVLIQRGQEFDVDKHCRLIDDLIAVCDADFFERLRPFGSDSQLPVFIAGMPRSGTTLVEQILSSHPQVFGAGEMRDLHRMVQTLPKILNASEPYPACLQRLDGSTVRALAEQHLQRLSTLGGSATRVVDKQLSNPLDLGIIAALFPGPPSSTAGATLWTLACPATFKASRA